MTNEPMNIIKNMTLDEVVKYAMLKPNGKECKGCGGKMGSFVDEVSKREAEISGLCQKCQDEVFTPDGDMY